MRSQLTNIIWGEEPDQKNDTEEWRDFYNESPSMVTDLIPRAAEDARVDRILRNPSKSLAECRWEESFEDLDQILSNDDLIFGNVNLGSTDELWSDAKNAAASFDLGELRDPSVRFEIKEEYLQEDDRDFTLGYDHLAIKDYPTDQKQQICSANEIAMRSRRQASPQKPLLKQRNRRKTEKNELSNQKNNRAGSFKPPSRHATDANLLPSQHESVPYRVHTLTPQEKIEKLRKRQQMQAMLAIQRQQKQQFGSHENMIHQNDVDDLSAFPRFDNFSSNEQDDSITVDDYSAEDAILYNLQEVVSKLDVKVRLCIRDSLYRLAQSAMQRHVACEASSSGKVATDGTELETESNPIDRTVAHLLFHRPMEQAGRRDTSDSSASRVFPSDGRAALSLKSQDRVGVSGSRREMEDEGSISGMCE